MELGTSNSYPVSFVSQFNPTVPFCTHQLSCNIARSYWITWPCGMKVQNKLMSDKLLFFLSGWPRGPGAVFARVCSAVILHDVLLNPNETWRMVDGKRWVPILRSFLVHIFHVALNCKNNMHLRFVKNANKHLITIQVDQGRMAKGQMWPFEGMMKKVSRMCFLSFCPIKSP